jgi:RNA polymerase sigma-70 factor, ECF subfamily
MVAVLVTADETARQDADRYVDQSTLDHAALGASPLSFEHVYEEQLDFVWRSLRLLGVKPEHLEDAAQDAFSVVGRRLAQFEGRSSLRTWIFGIVQRVAANHRRTERRKLAPLVPLADEAAAQEATAHARAEARELAACIERFCAELDEERRTLFVLVLMEEVPATEVAILLNIPPNTVYSRVFALRQALRRALEGTGRDG